jgi:hypothetical protein
MRDQPEGVIINSITVPCFSCGTPIRVILNENGYSVGCVYCEDCMVGNQSTFNSEDMIDRREY